MFLMMIEWYWSALLSVCRWCVRCGFPGWIVNPVFGLLGVSWAFRLMRNRGHPGFPARYVDEDCCTKRGGENALVSD